MVDDWRVISRPEPCLLGTVHGDPNIKEGRTAMTTALWLTGLRSYIRPAIGAAREHGRAAGVPIKNADIMVDMDARSGAAIAYPDLSATSMALIPYAARTGCRSDDNLFVVPTDWDLIDPSGLQSANDSEPGEAKPPGGKKSKAQPEGKTIEFTSS
jgi:hypothetical protein